jgi:hypothetical protein
MKREKVTTIDAYIAAASEGLKPVLSHIRDLIHEAIPNVEENIKWNAPSYELNGKIIASTMAFKAHVNFHLLDAREINDPDGLLVEIGEKSNMRGIKQIKQISDLPDKSKLIPLIQATAAGKG